MINKKALAILILLGLETTIYSLRFIKLSPETKLLPSEEVVKTLSGKNTFDKLNSSCTNIGNLNLNQGVFLNSQNINGYNPIFPKRLLRVVNASLGRNTNWVESVSLSMGNVNGSIFNLAGVNDCDDGTPQSHKQTPNDNTFRELVYIDDGAFYALIKSKTDLVKEGRIVLLNSDRRYDPQALEKKCSSRSEPKVELIGVNKVRTSSQCDFYYINPQLFYPGWYATDGQDISNSFPAFGYLQGYRISAGNKQIEFVYRPAPFQ